MLAIALASCGGGSSTSTTTATTAPAPVTSVASTTTSTTTSTSIVPPTFPDDPGQGSVPAVAPRARNSIGPCLRPEGSHYCVWGDRPLDLTVNNSRFVSFGSSIEQSFTALSGEMSVLQTELGASSAGDFEVAPAGTTSDRMCLHVSLAAGSGTEIAGIDLVAGTRTSSHEPVTLPLESSLVPGSRYSVTVRGGPACGGMTFTAMAVMTSDWKYPRAYGDLTVDGRRSIGSLWGRID